MTGRREERITVAQKELLVSFMLEHLAFSQGKLLGVVGRVEHNRLWQQLTVLLNSLEGAARNTLKWQKVWTDLKNKTKKKASEINMCRGKTRGGPGTTKRLTDMEEQIVHILCKGAVSDIDGPVDISLESGTIIETEPPQSEQIDVKPSTSAEYTFPLNLKDPLEAEDSEIEALSDSPVPSSPSSTSTIRRRGRSTLEKAVDTFSQLSTALNNRVGELNDTLKDILEEKKRTNQLLEDIVNVLKSQ